MSNSKISALTSATTPLAGTETLPVVQSSVTKQVSVADLTAGRSVSTASLAATTNTETAIVAGNASNDVGAGVRILGALTQRNWMISSNNFTAGLLEITPSTANGGTSFSTPVIKLNAAGNQTLTTGNLVIGTSGKGIDFSATAGTGTSELLADYEEGTWTPTQGNFGTWTSPVFSATYVKIGRSVTVNVRQTSGTIASGAAQRYINGLPFSTAVAGATGVSSNGSIIFVSNLLLYSDGKIYFISDTGSQTSLQFSLTYQV